MGNEVLIPDIWVEAWRTKSGNELLCVNFKLALEFVRFHHIKSWYHHVISLESRRRYGAHVAAERVRSTYERWPRGTLQDGRGKVNVGANRASGFPPMENTDGTHEVPISTRE